MWLLLRYYTRCSTAHARNPIEKYKQNSAKSEMHSSASSQRGNDRRRNKNKDSTSTRQAGRQAGRRSKLVPQVHASLTGPCHASSTAAAVGWFH